MLYEIMNPSDQYTIESSSFEVATVTSILLGQGNYSLKSLNGGEGVPAFNFGGGDQWAQEHFKESLMELSNRVMDTKLAEIADCLDSVLYGDEQDRIEFLESTKGMNRETFLLARAAMQDRKCSSMNDIGMRAYRMAAKLRKSIDDGIKTLHIVIQGGATRDGL